MYGEHAARPRAATAAPRTSAPTTSSRSPAPCWARCCSRWSATSATTTSAAEQDQRRGDRLRGRLGRRGAGASGGPQGRRRRAATARVRSAGRGRRRGRPAGLPLRRARHAASTRSSRCARRPRAPRRSCSAATPADGRPRPAYPAPASDLRRDVIADVGLCPPPSAAELLGSWFRPSMRNILLGRAMLCIPSTDEEHL